MSNLSLTQKWLSKEAARYSSKDIVYADIDAALAAYPMLRPKTDIYTYDDGRVKTLLCIHGLLSITFRGSIYNIPIACWITFDYPREPPITYVVPTNDMLVKAGKNVEVSGRCQIEYIKLWERKKEGCNVRALLEAMQSIFSGEPPLYARPRISTPERPPPISGSGPPPRPPPPIPINPASRDTMNQSNPPPSSVQCIPHQRTGSVHSTSPPPSSPLSRSHSDPRVQRWSVPLPLPAPFASPPPPPSLSGPPPPPPPPPPPLQPAIQPPIRDLLGEDDIEPIPGPSNASPPSTAPPRPPNPELLRLHAQIHQKLTEGYASLSAALAQDAERLRVTQADLLSGEPAIRDEMARLEAVRDVCLTVAMRTRSFIETAEANIAEMKRKGEPEVDELVCSTTIVYNQLIDLVAEDNAIEDAIYHLHRALNAGRIDLDRFIKATRELAAEQFMKRALIEKIETAIPMGTTLAWWSLS
ncbi:hypothetical protein BS47DRAFT_1331497 [Hydnum rufescens UP504]|uniref:UEV-domain-containing protein n=1 Tax=Hydnum rufescens UP504 TaxID=1448309 RepID=A0A9P6ART5_9AGAM|nr:hypothetical protein BS47DRAFT_1331497 [Hydnum rufescens UP504]